MNSELFRKIIECILVDNTNQEHRKFIHDFIIGNTWIGCNYVIYIYPSHLIAIQLHWSIGQATKVSLR